MPMRYAEVSQKELKFLDLTSLTVEEFKQLLPTFEEKFQERMKKLRLDGKPRFGRKHQTYSNCPLPTPEDRLLFILVYLKTNNLQIIQGELFGMPQNKANQWIHTLLPVLLTTMRSLGDTPARSMEQLSQRLGSHMLPDISSSVPDESSTDSKQEKHGSSDQPLFAMMGRNGASSAPKIRINRKATIAVRKNVTP